MRGFTHAFISNRMRINHPKLRGEWAELCFMTRAAEHGLRVTKPGGETAQCDFAVEYEEEVGKSTKKGHTVWCALKCCST
jgi:hypothetical protein